MIDAVTATRQAPDHWRDWLNQRSLGDSLRRLLLKLRLATPTNVQHDDKIIRLTQMIATADNAEREALMALAAIENQYFRDKKSNCLRQTIIPSSCLAAPRHSQPWLLLLALLKTSNWRSHP